MDFYSEEVMNDAIEAYGCNCDDCCSALLLNRALDKDNIREEKEYLSNIYLYEFCD